MLIVIGNYISTQNYSYNNNVRGNNNNNYYQSNINKNNNVIVSNQTGNSKILVTTGFITYIILLQRKLNYEINEFQFG